jgi:hypothetical protein
MNDTASNTSEIHKNVHAIVFLDPKGGGDYIRGQKITQKFLPSENVAKSQSDSKVRKTEG